MKLFLTIYLTLAFTLLTKGAGGVSGTLPLPKNKQAQVPIGKYRGKISGKVEVSPAVIGAVWLTKAGISAPPNPPKVTLAQQGYQFSKFLVVVPKGTIIEFPNRDPDYHNVYSLSKTERFDIGRYKANQTPVPSVTFDKAGYVKLRCEIHDHMNANIIVVDSPFYTTTDQSGKFTLSKIPAGEYTLHGQVDKKNKWQMPVTITTGKTLNIKFP